MDTSTVTVRADTLGRRVVPRHFRSLEEKLQIVAEARAPEASVAAVARNRTSPATTTRQLDDMSRAISSDLMAVLTYIRTCTTSLLLLLIQLVSSNAAWDGAIPRGQRLSWQRRQLETKPARVALVTRTAVKTVVFRAA